MTETSTEAIEATANKWQGDNLQTRTSNGNTRIMFHNIRHLSLRGASGIAEFIQEQEKNQIDLLAFSEHCLDTTKHQVAITARQIVRATYKGQALIQLHSSTEYAINQYKPGGVGIQILGQLTSTLSPQGRGGDTMGRWSFVSIRRHYSPPVSIISIYQVCPRPTNRVGNTAYHQQERILHRTGRHLHPRQAFVQDLGQLVATLRTQGHEIILGGDFNESLNDNDSGVLHLASRYQLIDPFLNKFPNHPEFGTHESGRKRIDSVLVTPGILPSITGIGYAPFEYSVHSDHRPLILELDTALFLGRQPLQVLSCHSRALFSKDKQNVRKYIDTLYSALDQFQVFSFQTKLDNDTATPEEVETIDALIGEQEDSAEQKCRRRRPEYYSQALIQQRSRVAILRRHLIALQKEQDRRTQLEMKLESAGIHLPLPLTKSLTKRALKQERDKLHQMRIKSFEIRQAALAQQLQEINSHSQRSHHKAISTIRKVEANLKTYRILKAMKNTAEMASAIDRVEIPRSWPPLGVNCDRSTLEDPKVCQEWKTESDPSAVEYYLLLRNRLHFGQAEGRPFTTHPLHLDLDWLARSQMAEEVLQGSYEYQGDISTLNLFLKECSAVAPLDSIKTTITMDELRSKFRTWRETTTTSPSGRHLGRYKALFVCLPENPEDDIHPDESIKFSDKQLLIAHLKLSIINYCLRNTYVLNRWKKVVNVMIQKEPGNYKIHRLRVIHIYEADYNALCAIQWRKLLKFADKHQLINEGQYGGRPGCEAQSLTLLEELKYDISYMSRRSLFNFDNDAMSCYDRIVVPMASLINRKYGLSRYVVALHAATLQEAQFYLKTANGISNRCYSHCAEFPIHGTGQGSGNSPCIWLFISSTLYDAHARISQGAFFSSPDGTCTLRLSMVGFVDDATGSCNDFRPQNQHPLPQLFQRMTDDAQTWNDLLFCSGGKLELSKCSFHLLHFDFKPNGRPVPSMNQYDGAIQLVDAETQERIPIPSKRAMDLHKTLGHYKAPVNVKPDISILQIRANQIATLIASSPITRQGARLAYQTLFLPTIKYTLPQSFYTRSTLESAQASPHSKLISKCGFNRHTARAIMYAPPQYAGGGFIPWHVLQGEGQVVQFIKHWRTGTLVSKALRITVSWAQWQSGYSQSILKDVITPIPHLECRWFKSLREFLATIQGQLLVTTPFVSTPERKNDIYIMEFARSCGIFTNEELKILNYCRLYLHVTTVSELLEANGTDIIMSLYHCQREPWFDRSTYITLQRRPSQQQIQSKWQRLCRQWFTSQGKLAMSLSIGKWLKPGNQLRRRREAYLDMGSPPKLYYWRNGCYWKYQVNSTNKRYYQPVGPTSWQPIQPCTPVTIRSTSNTLLIVPLVTRRLPAPPQVSPPKTFEQMVQMLPQWQSHLLSGIIFHLGPYEIMHHLTKSASEGTPLLVSDGSQCDNRITYGWVFGNTQGQIYAEHSGYGFGTLTSHRAEAWGVLSGVQFLQQLIRYTSGDISHPSISTVTCLSDNSGLISRLNSRQQYEVAYPNSTLEPDWDLVEQIYSTCSDVHPVRVEFSWVRGHQDDSSEDLPVEAQYNVLADTLASQVEVPHYVQTQRSPWILPSEQCQFLIAQRSLHGHYISEIRTAYTLPPLLSYLQRRHNWRSDTSTQVDWQSFTQAVKTSLLTPTQLTKLVYDKLPTRYELSKSNRYQSPACPHCSSVETFSHLLKCSHEHSTMFRINLQANITKYVRDRGVDESVTQLIWAMLKPIFSPSDQSTPNDTRVTKQFADVIEHQSQIGFHLVPKGFLTTRFRHYVSSKGILVATNTSKQAIDFTAGLINELWKAQMELWKNYQEEQYSNTNSTTRLHEIHQECLLRIRLLHDRQHLCLAGHRDKYFYPDVEAFLANATASQMKSYLQHYEPVILHSIKQAANITTRPLSAYPGFIPIRRQRLAPPAPTKTPTNGRGQMHPKHSRWKSGFHTRSIRTYFHDQNTPSFEPP